MSSNLSGQISVRPKSTPTHSDGRDDIDILRTVAIDTPRSLKREQSTTSGLPIIRLLHKCNLQHILCDYKKLLIGIAIVLVTITAVANEGRTPSIKTENVNILKQTGISSSNGLDRGQELPVVEESDNINLLRGRPSSKSKNDSKCGVIFFYHINKVGGRTVQEHLKESTHQYLQYFANEKDWTQALPDIESFLNFDGATRDMWKTLEIHHGFPGLLLQQNLIKWEAVVKSQGCAFKKVTLLRNPIERLVSNIKWNKVAAEDFASYIDQMSNWMTRHLAFNICNEELICSWKKRTGVSNSPEMSDEHYLSLIEVLDTFDVVGVMEDLQSFVNEVLGRHISLISTHKQSYSDQPYPLSANEYQQVVKKNLYDFRLYWRYAPNVLPISIERGDTMTFEKMRQYYILNKPVLIRNAAPFLFINYQDFSSGYVRNNVDPEMQIMASHESGRLLNGDLLTTVPKCMDLPDRCVYFKKSKFSYEGLTDEIVTDDDDSLRTTLLSGLNRSSFAWKGKNSGIYNIYISNHGGALPHNHGQRFNLLFEGKKRWVLVDPTTYANASQVKEFELEEETGLSRKKRGLPSSSYKPQEWFRDVISKFVEIPHYDFIQEPGDLFFLPDGFTHGTMDLTQRTIGIIFRGEMTTVGEDQLNFTPLYKDVQHLPWRQSGRLDRVQTQLPCSFPRPPRSPSANRNNTKMQGRGWQRVAGSTAKYFSNNNLDYRYSQ